jgi:L-ascorbate metabolism protein UlaG (beta-lactamase superfamily)
MTITKFEQSGFIFQTDNGFRFAVDIAGLTPLENLEGITVDAVFVSHIHRDHFSLEHIKKLNPKTVYLNRECRDTVGEEVLPFDITEVTVGDTVMTNNVCLRMFNVDHGPNVSAPIAENFGFLITADHQTIYFAGDMFYPSGIDVQNLSVDYALLPIGTHYTFGPTEAYAFAKTFRRIGTIIPIHYQLKPETKDEFIKLVKDITIKIL